MLTKEEHDAWCRDLEERRGKHADIGTVWPTPDDTAHSVVPVEIAPGRGDLRVMSGFYPAFPTALSLVGHKTVSFARLYMSQPWVAAAVDWMVRKAVRVPFHIYRRNGDDPADRTRLHPGEHPLADAVAAPWNRGSTMDLVQAMLAPLLVHGNSTTVVENGAGGKVEFVPKDFRFCRPIMPFRDSIAGFTFDYDQPSFMDEVPIDRVLHCKWWSPTGPIGVSPLQQLGVTIQIEDAAQRWQRSMLHQGARPSGAVSMTPEFLGLKQAEREQIILQVRRDLRELYSGPENAGKPALLPPGLTWMGINTTAIEAELIEQRKITREEVSAVYQIPPPLLGILDRATYSNIQTQRDMTYTDVLGGPLVMLEQTFNGQIVRDLLQEPDLFGEFNFGAVLRGDPLAEIDALRDAIASALMTPNEGRSMLKLKQDENPAMDEFYFPSNNLTPVGTPPRPVVVPFGQTPPPPPPPGQKKREDPPEDFPGQPPNEPTRRGRALHVKAHDGDFTELFS
jgi:HK97 family phage portal protein